MQAEFGRKSTAKVIIMVSPARHTGGHPDCATHPHHLMQAPLPRRVTVIEILALPTRRGPAAEAQACYRTLDDPAENPIAASDNNSS